MSIKANQQRVNKELYEVLELAREIRFTIDGTSGKQAKKRKNTKQTDDMTIINTIDQNYDLLMEIKSILNHTKFSLHHESTLDTSSISIDANTIISEGIHINDIAPSEVDDSKFNGNMNNPKAPYHNM